MTDFPDQLQKALAPAYDLDREITGGGMSRVFVAIERALGRRVVVKVLPPDLAAGVNKDRFRREIQLAAQLQHPHIVPLLSAGESDGLLWYTMPFVEGESLREALTRRGRFAPREVLRTLHDVVDALSYAHSRGVIHRDIKPANILTHGQHALVADFGVAKALSAAMPHSGTTSVGIAIGTPAYMAPEQLAADPAADHRVDLYAVGLLAYELLTGEQPFTGASPQATMAAQLTRMPTPLDQCCPDVPPELSAVIMRCLAKSPEERPQSARELLDALDGLTTPHGGTMAAATPRSGGTPASMLAGSVSGAAAATVPAGTGRRPTRRVALLAGLGAVAVVGGLVALSQRGVRVGDRVTNTTPVPVAGVAPGALDSAGLAAGTPAAASARAGAGASASPAGGAAPAPRTDTARTATATAALTRDDSLRIAEAVQRRVAAAERAQARKPEPGVVNLDSLRREIARQYADPAMREVVIDAFRAAEQARIAEQLSRMQVDLRAFETLRVRAPQPPQPPGTVGSVGPIGSLGTAVRPNVVIGGTGARASAARTSRRVAWLGIADRTGSSAMAGEVRGLNEVVRRALVAAGWELVDEGTAARIAAQSSSRARRAAADSLGIGAVVAGTATMRADALRADAQVLDVGRNRLRSMSERADAGNPREVLGIVGEIVEALADVRTPEPEPAAPSATGQGGSAARAAPQGSWVVSGRPRMILFELDDRTGAAGGAELARAISDSLRRLVRRTGLEVVDDEVTRAVPRTTARRREAGTRYAAGAIAAGSLSRRRDTLVVQMSVRDMHAGQTFESFQARVPVSTPLDAVASIGAALLGQLGRVNWSARLVAPPSAVTPPTP